MNNDICSICLDNINNDTFNKTLSCGHMFHYKCIIKCVFNSNSLFIKCPLCRKVNLNIERPFKDEKENILSICSSNLKTNKCISCNKNGKPCMNNAFLFNYGYCHVHNKNILRKKHYKIFYTYFEYLFTSPGLKKKGWKTKLYMLDIAKKLIIQRDINKLELILNIFNKHFEKYNYKKENTPDLFYKLHNIELPPKEWINFCNKKKILF